MTQRQPTRSDRVTVQGGGDWIDVEPSPRWVRVVFNGENIADSRRVLLVRESGLLPAYYFPREDVRMDVLMSTDYRSNSPLKGEANYWSVSVRDRIAENAAWTYLDPGDEAADLKGYIGFEWHKMGAWIEEDEEIFAHPRDPHKRVDVLPSSRHIRVVVGGETISDTRRPKLLFETGMPTRYYVSPEDVRMDLLRPSDTTSRCPYKGQASYWRPTVGDTSRDIAWSYLVTLPECPRINGLIAFFNERVEAIYVDGELQSKPGTRWA